MSDQLSGFEKHWLYTYDNKDTSFNWCISNYDGREIIRSPNHYRIPDFKKIDNFINSFNIPKLNLYKKIGYGFDARLSEEYLFLLPQIKFDDLSKIEMKIFFSDFSEVNFALNY